MDETILGRDVLVEVMQEGESIELFGLSESTLKQGKWEISFEGVETSPRISGEPLTAFRAGEFVFSGSEEEEELIREKERQRELAEQQRNEQLEREKAAEAERLEAARAEERQRLEVFRSLLVDGQRLNGEAGDQRASWPFQLSFTEFDPGNDAFMGRMEWPTLNGVTRIEGTLVGSRLIFTETEHIERGDVALNTVYEFNALEDGRVRGHWNSHESNWAWFSLPSE